MQIISRRVCEGVVIGEETQITVLRIDQKTKSVRLGIRSTTGKLQYREVTLYLPSDDGGDARCEADPMEEQTQHELLSAVL